MNNKPILPPKLAAWILHHIAVPEERFPVTQNLEEDFREYVSLKGKYKARIMYWHHVLKTVFIIFCYKTYWRFSMFKSYFITAIRNMLRQKGYSFINIMGLAIGIACSVFILLYIQFELSFDRYHEDADRIFRIAVESNSAEYGKSIYADAQGILAPTIQQNYGEVEHAVRISKREYMATYGENSFYDNTIIFTDPAIFKVFSIPLIAGDPSTALEQPYTLLITKNIADTYFSNQDPVGKIINISEDDYTITGIAENPPDNTHFKYSILVSMKTIENDDSMFAWDRFNFHTYIKLKENASSEAFENKIRNIAHNYIGDELEKKGRVLTFFLQPLTSIHLHSHFLGELEENGNPVYLYIFSAACVLILLIACINFINLTTARAAKRSNEVGIRKVVGATRAQLSMQFLGESLFFALIGTLSAFLIVGYFLPFFSNIVGIQFSFSHLLQPAMMMIFVGIVITIGFAAGGYPALFLSALRPVKIFKGTKGFGSDKSGMRKTLVVGQFAVSITLIICSLLIHKQLHYVQNMNLGFDKEQKLIIPVRDNVRDRVYLQKHFETVKREFMNHASIYGATILSIPPGIWSHYWQMVFERGDNSFTIQVQPVDINFIKEYGIKMLAGRSFQRDMSTDNVNAIIINRVAAKALGFSKPEESINQKIRKKTEVHKDVADELNIIGVADDFNYYELKSKIQPVMMVLYSGYFKYISLTVDPGNLTEILSFVKKKWTELFPGRPFEYYFLNDHINSQFRSEEQLGTVFGIFTGLGIFIACLGLFGLSAFMAEQRTKEIGIRKVLGSSVIEIVVLLTKEFTKWVLLANLFAWPIAYYFMNKWLQNFAYRTSSSLWVFVLSAFLTLVLALLTVTFQTIKAAAANPVDSLRYE